jgi:hypothetical protein
MNVTMRITGKGKTMLNRPRLFQERRQGAEDTDKLQKKKWNEAAPFFVCKAVLE